MPEPQAKPNLGLSTTAQVMVGLYNANPENKTLDLESNTTQTESKLPSESTKKAAALQVWQSKTLLSLTSPNQLEFTQGAINSNLTLLKTEKNEEKQKAYAGHLLTSGQLVPEIGRLQDKQKQLLTEYQALVREENSAVEKLKTEFLNNQISASELTQNITAIKDEFKNFAVRILGAKPKPGKEGPTKPGLVHEIQGLQDSLDSLNQKVWNLLPPEKQGGGVPPRRKEEEVIPAGAPKLSS